MNIDKLIKAVEEKTGETILSVTVQKDSVLNNFLCKLGFHKRQVKSGDGHFVSPKCILCGKY